MADQLHILLSGDVSAKWNGLAPSLRKERSTVLIRCNSSPEQVLSLCRRLAPCILVIDDALIDTIDQEQLSALIGLGQSVQVLVEGDNIPPQRVEYLISLGCAGVMARSAKPAEACRALRAISQGEVWGSRRLVSGLLRKLLCSARSQLTLREHEVLSLMAQRLNNSEIAERLLISTQTVRWHLRSLYHKLGTHNRVVASAVASKAPEALRTPGSGRTGVRFLVDQQHTGNVSHHESTLSTEKRD